MKLRRRFITGIVDEFAQARGSYDVEFVVCAMSIGRNKVREADDADVQEFIDDRNEYWRKRGWHLVKRGEKNVLTPLQAAP